MKSDRARAWRSPRPPTGRSTFLLGLVLLAAAAGAQEEHDCVSYEPTEAGQVIASTWQAQFEVDDYQFTVPADPGGGYVVARIDTTAPSSPQMRIIPPSGLGVVAQAAPDLAGPSPFSLEVAFEVDAGTTFDVEVFETVVSQAADFPVPYQWSWTFVSRVDCYEPNDGRAVNWPDPVATSRTVPLDQVIEAFSLAGYQTFGISAVDAPNFDWYDFTITVPTEISVATLEVPSDQSIRVRLVGSDGLTLLDQVPPVGETAMIGPTMLQPGTYYVDLHPEVRGESSVTLSEGEPLPDHFESPYRFIVSSGRCTPSPARACALDGRYAIEVDWQDFAGATGLGQVVGGSDDSKRFAFFDPDNWEMLVKVLDACAFNGNYWVFSAATTDVEYTLRVTDTVTGAVRVYDNMLGQAADAIADTRAFPCDDSGAGSPVASSRRLQTGAQPLRAASSGSGCFDDEAVLCLSSERFALEVEWTDFEGTSGVGRVVPLRSADSGLFWFFDPDNWEMLVKVLDACAINGNFWVFSAATTNVEYTLRVTDTSGSVVREYRNELGRAAPAVTDTTAISCRP